MSEPQDFSEITDADVETRMKQTIGFVTPECAQNSVALEIMECMDIAMDITLAEMMLPSHQELEFVEAEDEGYLDTDKPPPPLDPVQQAIIDATVKRCNATHALWQRRLALAQAGGPGYSWAHFRAQCAVEPIAPGSSVMMTPGENADQLLARLLAIKGE